jgi:hypothetical protein
MAELEDYVEYELSNQKFVGDYNIVARLNIDITELKNENKRLKERITTLEENDRQKDIMIKEIVKRLTKLEKK